MKRMIDTNVIKALLRLFKTLSDLSDAELGRFVKLAVTCLRSPEVSDLTEEDAESLVASIFDDAGDDEEPKEEEGPKDIPADCLHRKVDFVMPDEDAARINVVLYPRVKQSILVHFKPAREEASADDECEQECCHANERMVYEEVTGNMENVRPAVKDDAKEQERLKACARVAAFIRDNCKASHLEIWQCMQNEGLSTVQDVMEIDMRLDGSMRSLYIRDRLIYFIQMKTLLENGQARFLDSRIYKGKEAIVAWKLCGDYGKGSVVMGGHEEGSLFMVTQCDPLLPEYISVKLRRVMCENYDAIMEDVYAMCARLSKADTFNAVPITKDEFNTLRNLVL